MFPSVWGEPKKCKPKTESKELTHSLIQIPKSFNKRNMYVGKAVEFHWWLAEKYPHPSSDRFSFYRRLIVKPYGG